MVARRLKMARANVVLRLLRKPHCTSNRYLCRHALSYQMNRNEQLHKQLRY
jgi:hypothetical protein